MTADRKNSHGKRYCGQTDYDENSGSKRRDRGDDRDSPVIDRADTVYRYLCPMKNIGSVIGRGGEIVKRLRVGTKSKISIGESIPGCDERVITIYSPSDETNAFEYGDYYVSPAQDALFKIHDRVVAEDLHGEERSEGDQQVTARLLVPSDQIGCVLGIRGQIVQNIRSETGAQIRIIRDRNMPPCALSSEELIQISGEVPIVKRALHQIASRLHENPSRTQHLLSSTTVGGYPSGSLISQAAGAQIVGIAPLVGSYGGYKSDAGNWSRSIYQAPRNEASTKEFSLRLVSPVENIGGVIGKGGSVINQLRQDTKATIKVDSSKSEGNDCLITISASEYFEDAYSPTIEAVMRLLPKCSEKVERYSGLVSFTMRLLVHSSRIGCLLGKGGAIVTEMRRMTKASIRILGKENLPKVAFEDDEIVQISGELDVAKEALIQITSRLRANFFDREGVASAVLPVAPDASDRLDYDSRDSRRPGCGNHYPGGYGSSGLPAEGYLSYGALEKPIENEPNSHVAREDADNHPLTQEMVRLLQQVNERMERLELGQREPPQVCPHERTRGARRFVRGGAERYAARREEQEHSPSWDEMEGELEEQFEADPFEVPRRPRRMEHCRERLDDELSGIRMEIPPFNGRGDAEAYLEWESKTEMVFDYQHYSELKKVKMVVSRFSDYALVWWDQIRITKRNIGEAPIATWNVMKKVMRRRFVPSHYHRDVCRRLRQLVQGSCSVEEYYKEMEMLMIRANIEEDVEVTNERFLGGLNVNIQERVEHFHYETLEDLLHVAIRVEHQLKRKGKMLIRPECELQEKQHTAIRVELKGEQFKPKKQGTIYSSDTRNCDIKCYRCMGFGHHARDCANKRVMVIRDGKVETDSEYGDDKSVDSDGYEEIFAC